VRLGGQAVQRPRSDVQIRVGCTEGEEQDASVENTGEVLDVGILDGDDERRSRGFGSLLVGSEQFIVVVRDEHAQEKHAQAVKEQDPVEGKLDGARNRLARVLCFTDRHTNEFGACRESDEV
jgi:DNA-binding transcriptional LysR family regulator